MLVFSEITMADKKPPMGGQNSKTEITWKREASFGKSFFTAFRELFFTVQPKMIEVIDVFLYLGYSTC